MCKYRQGVVQTMMIIFKAVVVDRRRAQCEPRATCLSLRVLRVAFLGGATTGGPRVGYGSSSSFGA